MTDQHVARRFHLRHNDARTAEGVVFSDGTVAVRKLGPGSNFAGSGFGGYISLEAATPDLTHAHAQIVWDDPEPIGWDQADMQCPHCPDGYTPPTGGSQSWAVHLAPHRDGDGQPTTIHVGRTAGTHVAESDAEWVRQRLNGGA